MDCLHACVAAVCGGGSSSSTAPLPPTPPPSYNTGYSTNDPVLISADSRGTRSGGSSRLDKDISESVRRNSSHLGKKLFSAHSSAGKFSIQHLILQQDSSRSLDRFYETTKEKMGDGAFGSVMKVRHRETGRRKWATGRSAAS